MQRPAESHGGDFQTFQNRKLSLGCRKGPPPAEMCTGMSYKNSDLGKSQAVSFFVLVYSARKRRHRSLLRSSLPFLRRTFLIWRRNATEEEEESPSSDRCKLSLFPFLTRLYFPHFILNLRLLRHFFFGINIAATRTAYLLKLKYRCAVDLH